MNEIGRRLRLDELKKKTVVVVAKVGNPNAVTAWVSEIHEDYVTFYMGVTKTTFIAKRQGDDLVDNVNSTIEVFEFLGVVQERPQ
jgi:hypothetical protein